MAASRFVSCQASTITGSKALADGFADTPIAGAA
jgi:hypothetical protein